MEENMSKQDSLTHSLFIQLNSRKYYFCVYQKDLLAKKKKNTKQECTQKYSITLTNTA